MWLLVLISLVVVSLIAVLVFLRTVWFHRDPEHTVHSHPNEEILSPVYGIVAYIKKIEKGRIVAEKKEETIEINEITKDDWPNEFLDGSGWLIGIAMTALDVHFQYAPLSGEIVSINHKTTGRNLPMFDLWEYIRITWFRKWVQLIGKKYLLENERQTMWLQTKHAKIALVLIADKFVDKITTFVKVNEQVKQAQKLSFIGRGSQVDVVICGHHDLELKVTPGDAVKGPNTTLACLKPSQNLGAHSPEMPHPQTLQSSINT